MIGGARSLLKSIIFEISLLFISCSIDSVFQFLKVCCKISITQTVPQKHL